MFYNIIHGEVKASPTTYSGFFFTKSEYLVMCLARVLLTYLTGSITILPGTIID